MIARAGGSTVHVGPAPVVRRDRDWSHVVDRLQASARDLVVRVFPEAGLKRFRLLRWFPYHGLSRARNGANCPLARAAVWMAGLCALGIPRQEAQLLVDWLQDVVNELWPPETIALIAASDEEQHWEGIETALQLVVMREIEQHDFRHVPEYLDACRHERAAQDAIVVGLEALLLTLQRGGALPAPAPVPLLTGGDACPRGCA